MPISRAQWAKEQARFFVTSSNEAEKNESRDQEQPPKRVGKSWDEIEVLLRSYRREARRKYRQHYAERRVESYKRRARIKKKDTHQ